jgi:hypothetical protein
MYCTKLLASLCKLIRPVKRSCHIGSVVIFHEQVRKWAIRDLVKAGCQWPTSTILATWETEI